MAKHGWIASIGLSVGTAAAAAATQFGLGYGLGIISWAPATGTTTPDNVWLASLAWTTFIAATSTVVGAIYADRRSLGSLGAAPPRPVDDGGLVPPGALATAAWRTLLAFCAAVGALLAVALVLVPAQAAARPDASSPELIAAGYAVVGIVLGIIIAACALAARAAAVNVLATSAVLWVFAIAAVIDGYAVDRGVRVTPLAAWPFGPGIYFRATWSVEGTLLMFGTALVIGAAAGWQAIRRTDNRVGIALSGAVGPLMIAAAYLFSTPHLVGVDANPQPQLSTYLVAPYAVLAGLAGSVLAVAVTSTWEANVARRDGLTVGPPATVSARMPVPAPAPRPATGASWLSGLDETTDTDTTADLGLPSGSKASGSGGGTGTGAQAATDQEATTARLRPSSRSSSKRRN